MISLKDRKKIEDSIQRKEWHLSDQKKYCSVAINNLKKLDNPTPRLIAIIEELEAHRKKMND